MVKRVIRRFLERIQSPTADRVTVALSRWIYRRWGYVPGFWRSAVLSLWSTDPLRKARDVPPIDIGIVFALKDARLVPAAVLGAFYSSANPIKVVRLVAPDLDEPAVRDSIEAVQQFSSRLGFIVETYSDEALLGSDRLHKLKGHQVRDRSLGWVTQQLLKLSTVLISDQKATLIVDADTILLRRRTWLTSDGKQILMSPEWFRSLWTDDVERFLGRSKTLPFSFIAHHQLMQRDLVARLFGDNGERLLEWGLSARRRIAEYETYGTYLAEVHSSRMVPARFGNIEDTARSTVASIRKAQDLEELSGKYPSNCLSLSVHHYLTE